MACAGAAAPAAHSRPGMHVENVRMLWVYFEVMSLQGSCDYWDFSLEISHIHLAVWWCSIYVIIF